MLFRVAASSFEPTKPQPPMSFNSLAARSAVAIPRCALHAGATQKPKQPIVQQPAWRRHQAAAAGLAAAGGRAACSGGPAKHPPALTRAFTMLAGEGELH